MLKSLAIMSSTYNPGHNSSRLFALLPFFSPQVKRSVIISNKHSIYELPHELPNDLRLRSSENRKRISKSHRIIAQCPVSPPK